MPFIKSTYITVPNNIPAIPIAETAKTAVLRPTKHFQIISEDNPDMVITLKKQREYVKQELAKCTSLTNAEILQKERQLKLQFQQKLADDAHEEQEKLIKEIVKHGIPTRFIMEDKTSVVDSDGEKGTFEPYTDQIFATDTGQYYDKNGVLHFIPASFKNSQRKDEEKLAIVQASNIGAVIQPLHRNETFEGGDIRQMIGRKLFFIGHGHRNSPKVGERIANESGYLVLPIKLLQEQFYHLDCCFLPLPNDCAVIYEGEYQLNQKHQKILDANGWPLIEPGTATMAPESRALIRKVYPPENLVLISKPEAKAYATNAVVLQNPKTLKFKLFVNGKRNMNIISEQSAIESQQISLRYQSIMQMLVLTKGEMEVIETPYTTMHGSGGSVRCTVLELACSNDALIPQKNNRFYFSSTLDKLEEQLQSRRKLKFFQNPREGLVDSDIRDSDTRKRANSN
jgi:N-dimethylarginine dimethylaminohydrolase